MTINYSGSKITDRLRRAFRTVGRANPLLEESLLPVTVVEDVSLAPYSMIEQGGFEEQVVGVALERSSLGIGMFEVGLNDVLVVRNLQIRIESGTCDIGRINAQIDAGFSTKSSGRTDFRFASGDTSQVQAGQRSEVAPLVLDSTIYRFVPLGNQYQSTGGIWVLPRNTTLVCQPVAVDITLRFQGQWELYRNVS